MINIVVDNINQKISYTCEVLFRYILRTEFRVTERKIFDNRTYQPENEKSNVILYYAQENPDNSLCIPCSGFLHKDEVVAVNPSLHVDSSFPKLFPAPNSANEPNFDLLAASFYLLCEYDKFTASKYDNHGRYLEEDLYSFKHKLHRQPLVHLYAEHLWTLIKKRYPGLKRDAQRFNYEISIDIDHPWAYLHKGLTGYAGFIKDIVRLDFSGIERRYNAFRIGSDPYFTFPYLIETVDNEKLQFFFLINRESSMDGRHTYKCKAYRDLISSLSRSVRIGLHPSYNTAFSKQALQLEAMYLKSITSQHPKDARQHYLRYRLPQTRTYYSELGIVNDYNAVMIRDIGFPCGMCIPFPYFNLTENRMTGLVIHPAQAMDVALKNYMRLNPEEAKERLTEVIEKSASVNGKFLLVWHNSSLTEYFGWKGWKSVFEETMALLKKKFLSGN